MIKMPSIKVENLSKSYGSFKALDSISFEYSGNRVVGYLGPNGAGKTTTLKIMTNLLRPDSGNVLINGINVNHDSVVALNKIGSLVENPSPFPYFTVEESLRFVGDLRKVPKDTTTSKIKELSDLLRLPPLKSRIGQLSKGQRQRVVLASTLISDPEVLILDEPTSGLDPFEMKIIRDLIKELKNDHLVLMSSHLLSEVAEICDDVIFIGKGKILARENVADISGKFQTSQVEIEFLGADLTGVVKSLENMGYNVTISNGSKIRIKFSGKDEERAKILADAMKLAPVISFVSVGSALEDAYISILGGTA